ncbi:MAG: 6-phosphogluconolactonase [Gammaproteobacteria bacterium]|nr:6-phosphogluconolactonase [Gammaproteobacteria bacterium]
MSKPELYIHSSYKALCHGVAKEIASLAHRAEQRYRPFNVAFSGGSTPENIYQSLASTHFCEEINWGGFNIYFGDERMVAPDHQDSNYLMVKNSLLDHCPIPSANIHAIKGELQDPHTAAAEYQKELIEHLDKSESLVPIFDLVLLGIGSDGHTASLFPDTDILLQHEKWVDAVYVKKLDSWRISITLPIINNAKNIIIIASGKPKADIIKEVFSKSHPNKKTYPIQLLQPSGLVTWHIDQAASEGIKD